MCVVNTKYPHKVVEKSGYRVVTLTDGGIHLRHVNELTLLVNEFEVLQTIIIMSGIM